MALNENESLKESLAAERQCASSSIRPSGQSEAALQRTERENDRLNKQVALLQDQVDKFTREKRNEKDDDDDDDGSKTQLRSLTQALAKFKKRRADETSAASKGMYRLLLGLTVNPSVGLSIFRTMADRRSA